MTGKRGQPLESMTAQNATPHHTPLRQHDQMLSQLRLLPLSIFPKAGVHHLKSILLLNNLPSKRIFHLHTWINNVADKMFYLRGQCVLLIHYCLSTYEVQSNLSCSWTHEDRTVGGGHCFGNGTDPPNRARGELPLDGGTRGGLRFLTRLGANNIEKIFAKKIYSVINIMKLI